MSYFLYFSSLLVNAQEKNRKQLLPEKTISPAEKKTKLLDPKDKVGETTKSEKDKFSIFKLGFTNKAKVAIRKSPSPTSPMNCLILKKGTIVRVAGAKKDWVRVRFGKCQGYAYEKVITLKDQEPSKVAKAQEIPKITKSEETPKIAKAQEPPKTGKKHDLKPISQPITKTAEKKPIEDTKPPVKEKATEVVSAVTGNREAQNLFIDGVEALDDEDYQAAIDFFQKAIQLYPNYLEYRYYLGITYGKMKNYDQAIKIFEKILDRDPKNYFKVYFDLAGMYNRQGAWEKALTALEQAEKINPNEPRLHLEKGYILKNIKDFDGAINSFKRILELDPNQSQFIYYNIASTHFEPTLRI